MSIEVEKTNVTNEVNMDENTQDKFDDHPNILHDVEVFHNGQMIIAKLRSDGVMLLGKDKDDLREQVFFIGPASHKPWLPDEKTFVQTIRACLTSGEIDIDADRISPYELIRGVFEKHELTSDMAGTITVTCQHLHC